ncbi:MAG: hypothetical protein DRJ40_07125 [Thermoprotei archaeon]|nr:MAG: hypothetical protein DRJ40_07125 [Thermoprotei archaeon]
MVRYLRAATGVNLLDNILEGGLPRPAVVMISGDVGVGKNLLAQQILWYGLMSGEKCIYVTIDMFPEDVLESMERFGWNVREYFEREHLIFVDCFSPRVGHESKAQYVVENPFNVDELLETLSLAQAEVYSDGSYGRLVLSHLSTLLFTMDRERIYHLMAKLHAEARKYNAIYLLVYTEGVLDENTEVFLRQLPDVVIRLKRFWKKGRAYRVMWIEKCVKTVYSKDRYVYRQTDRGFEIEGVLEYPT